MLLCRGSASVEVRERIGHKQKVVMEEGEEGNIKFKL